MPRRRAAPGPLLAAALATLLVAGCAATAPAGEEQRPSDRAPGGLEASADAGRPGDDDRSGPTGAPRSDVGGRSAGDEGLPSYRARVSTVGASVRRRMIGVSHDPGRCPVDLSDLRLLRVSYVGFDARQHTGELLVAARHARGVVRVFERLYDARFPIRRMRLVSAYGGDDNRSMAANNTSGYNCRRVAGQESWSAHAYGAAIDINPVQNPYVTGGGVLPPQGRRFVDVDRSPDAEASTGVVTRDDVVVRAFRSVGWSWGGDWNQPDYQHFSAR